MNLTIGDILRNRVRTSPSRPAIVGDDYTFTYEQFNKRVNRLANGLSNSGLTKGDRLGVLLMNCYQFIEIIMACAKAGIVLVPINWRFQGTEISYIVDNSDSTGLILGEEFIPVIESTVSSLKSIPNDRYWVVGDKKVSVGGDLYENLIKTSTDEEPSVSVDPSDIFFFGYTSGTTGFPKGAVILHETDVTLAQAINIEYELEEGLTNLIVMPTFHSNSIWNTVASILGGATIYTYHLKGFNGEEILSIIDRFKINMSSMVPTMLNIILALPDEVKSKYDVSSMKVLISSSAPISDVTKIDIMKYFPNARLFEGYGSTETGLVSSLRPEEQIRKLGSVGKPAYRKEIEILDENGAKLGPGQIGEIYTKGVSIFREYHKNPEATKAAFRGEWCTVGDMGHLDEEGYLFLVDRKNDMIISGGENIYPTEVENIISEHPAVQFVAVVGVPDDFWGESVKAVVVLKSGMSATEDEIIATCKDKLAGYKKPRSVDFVTELPMTSTGKILRRVVKENYWAGKQKRV